MIDLNGLIEVLADTFFNGDVTIAGIVIYTTILMIILALTRKAFITLLVALPVTFIFTSMNVLSHEMMIMMIIVVVLGLAYTSRGVWRD